MATKHEELLDTIGNMTVLELSEFVEEFKEKFNVQAMAAPVAVAAAAGGDVGGDAAEEKDEFDVVLEGVGDKKIQVIKVVRELTALGLSVYRTETVRRPTEGPEGVQSAFDLVLRAHRPG